MWGRWGTPQNFLLAFINGFWKTRKIRLLVKWKNLLEISPFYKCVPKTTIIWGTVSEIRSETEFFVILGNFNPLSPNNPQNCNFKKMEKISGDVIILNLCNKKTRPNDVCLLRYGVFAQTSHFRPVFAFMPHYWPKT